MRDEISDRAARLGVPLSAIEVGRLGSFLELLSVWNERFHLTGERQIETLARKHVPDSLALVPYVGTPGPIVDIGSGAGFPGLVLGCVRQDLDVYLVESRRKPASFLCEAVASLQLENVFVLCERAETASRRPALKGIARVVTGRAVGLDDLARLADPLLAPHGRLIAMQGRSMGDEQAAATAKAHRMRLLASHDYTLDGGELRRIIELAKG